MKDKKFLPSTKLTSEVIPEIWFSKFYLEQSTSEGFNSCDLPCNLTQFFSTWPWIWWMTLKNVVWASTRVQKPTLLGFSGSRPAPNPLRHKSTPAARQKESDPAQTTKTIGTSSILCQALCIISKPSVNSNLSYSPEILNFGQNLWFFCPMWPWNLTDDLELQSGNTQFGAKLAIFLSCVTLKFDRWPWKTMEHLYCTTSSLCIISKPSVNSNWNYSLETLNLGQNWCFLSHVTLKFDRWPWKKIGHLFCATSSFMHHLIAISEFKLELQSANAEFRSKSIIFLYCVTLKFDRWPWKTIGHLFYATSSFAHHFVDICKFKLELQFGNAQFGSKSKIFLSSVTLKFDGWPWKTISTSSMAHQALCIISLPYASSN